MGYGQGVFGTHRNITRGETAMFLYRLSGEQHTPSPGGQRFVLVHDPYTMSFWIKADRVADMAGTRGDVLLRYSVLVPRRRDRPASLEDDHNDPRMNGSRTVRRPTGPPQT